MSCKTKKPFILTLSIKCFILISSIFCFLVTDVTIAQEAHQYRRDAPPSETEAYPYQTTDHLIPTVPVIALETSMVFYNSLEFFLATGYMMNSSGNCVPGDVQCYDQIFADLSDSFFLAHAKTVEVVLAPGESVKVITHPSMGQIQVLKIDLAGMPEVITQFALTINSAATILYNQSALAPSFSSLPNAPETGFMQPPSTSGGAAPDDGGGMGGACHVFVAEGHGSQEHRRMAKWIKSIKNSLGIWNLPIIIHSSRYGDGTAISNSANKIAEQVKDTLHGNSGEKVMFAGHSQGALNMSYGIKSGVLQSAVAQKGAVYTGTFTVDPPLRGGWGEHLLPSTLDFFAQGGAKLAAPVGWVSAPFQWLFTQEWNPGSFFTADMHPESYLMKYLRQGPGPKETRHVRWSKHAWASGFDPSDREYYYYFQIPKAQIAPIDVQSQWEHDTFEGSDPILLSWRNEILQMLAVCSETWTGGGPSVPSGVGRPAGGGTSVTPSDGPTTPGAGDDSCDWTTSALQPNGGYAPGCSGNCTNQDKECVKSGWEECSCKDKPCEDPPLSEQSLMEGEGEH